MCSFLDTLLEIDLRFDSVFQATDVEKGGHSRVPECNSELPGSQGKDKTQPIFRICM